MTPNRDNLCRAAPFDRPETFRRKIRDTSVSRISPQGKTLNRGSLFKFYRDLIVAALMTGLVIGTLIGLAEGASVLINEGLLGRYNELLSWAIAFDAPTLIAIEIGLAVLSSLFLLAQSNFPPARALIPLLSGETVFVAVLALGIWTLGSSHFSLLARAPFVVIIVSALVGLALALLTLAVLFELLEHVQFFRRLRARYWLTAEAAVLIAVVAFGMTH